MIQLRNLSQLQDALDTEMGWRIKEISNFKTAAIAQSAKSSTFIRAGVALVYAHWEGFIKGASEHYLNFIENRGHQFNELKTCFAVFGLKGKLILLSESRKAKANIEALDFVMTEMSKRAKLNLASAINTESNLTSAVFSNIATSIDISLVPYEMKFNLIDESLVKRRNKIAHGEYLDLSATDFNDLADEILSMMRNYKTDIENAASLEQYRRISIQNFDRVTNS